MLGRAEGLYEELARPDPPAGRMRPSAAAAWRGWRSSRPTAAGTNRRPPTIAARSRCWSQWPRGETARPGPGRTWPSPTITSPARSCIGLGRLEEGERHLRRAIELRDALAAEHPDDPAYGTELSRSLSNLGELQNRAGKTAEALASVRRALDLQQDLVRRWPDDAQLRHQLSLTTRGAGDPPECARPAGGERAALPGIAGPHRAGGGREPGRDRVPPRAGDLIRRAGPVPDRSDALVEGLDCLGRAREQAELVRRSLPDDLSNLITLASVHRGIGKVLGKQGKPAAGPGVAGTCRRRSASGSRGRDSLPTYDLACTLALCSEVAAAVPAGAEGGGPGAAQALRRAVRRRAAPGHRRGVEGRRLDGARPGSSLAARPRRFPRGDPVPPPGDRARVKVDRGPLAALSGGVSGGRGRKSDCVRSQAAAGRGDGDERVDPHLPAGPGSKPFLRIGPAARAHRPLPADDEIHDRLRVLRRGRVMSRLLLAR